MRRSFVRHPGMPPGDYRRQSEVEQFGKRPAVPTDPSTPVVNEFRLLVKISLPRRLRVAQTLLISAGTERARNLD